MKTRVPSAAPGIEDYRKRFWNTFGPNPFFVSLIGVFLWLLGEQAIALAMWLYALVLLIILGTAWARPKYIQGCAGAILYFHVIFSFITVLWFGGILQSGGVALIGLAGAIFSLSFMSTAHSRILFFLFLFSVIAEIALQEYITPRATIGEMTNLVLFGTHILVIAFVMYLTISQYLKQSIEARQRETERLKELDTLKTNFYTGITHEFRTPLTVILGMAEHILKEPAGFARKGAGMIRDSGNRLLHLVNQMLNLSKLESGQMELRPIQADIIPFLEYLLEPFEWMAEDRDLQIRMTTPEEPVLMDFDPEKIESLVTNLLSNAIKYTCDKTEIDVEIKKTNSLPDQGSYAYRLFSDARVNKGQAYLRIDVRDEGNGIPENVLPSIFERYTQLENHNAHQLGGTGIGLSLVREIVDLLRGNLYVTTTPEEGSCFTLILPITNKAEISGIPPGRARNSINTGPEDLYKQGQTWPAGKAKTQVLVIEDNKNVRTYLSAILSQDYLVTTAPNGNMGTKKALETLPDLVITDIMMPGMDGFEVCETLKRDFRTSHIPVIMLTAKADMTSRIEGLEHGADDYLVKPFNQEELAARIKNLLLTREKLRMKYQLEPSRVPASTPESPDDLFFRDFRKVLEENLGNEQFSTGEMAYQLHMSRTQLFRKLKALTGQSASGLLRTYRLRTAQKLLETSALNISEIGYEVGYRDPAYFTKAFSREFGQTPSEYRQAAEKTL